MERICHAKGARVADQKCGAGLEFSNGGLGSLLKAVLNAMVSEMFHMEYCRSCWPGPRRRGAFFLEGSPGGGGSHVVPQSW
jgi:hypothetical protein